MSSGTANRVKRLLRDALRQVIRIYAMRGTSMIKSDWPELQGSPGRLIGYTTIRLFAGQLGASTSKERVLAISYIRLVAKAVHDFELAGSANDAAREPLSDFLSAIQVTDHLENCIVTLHRTLLFLNTLKDRGILTADAEHITLKPRSAPVLATETQKRIRDMRDAILHMDDRIMDGEYIDGTPIALSPRNGRLELESVVIRLDEIANWLDQLSEIAELLATRGVAGRTN